jgi:hypothetical protein
VTASGKISKNAFAIVIQRPIFFIKKALMWHAIIIIVLNPIKWINLLAINAQRRFAPFQGFFISPLAKTLVTALRAFVFQLFSYQQKLVTSVLLYAPTGYLANTKNLWAGGRLGSIQADCPYQLSNLPSVRFQLPYLKLPFQNSQTSITRSSWLGYHVYCFHPYRDSHDVAPLILQ